MNIATGSVLNMAPAGHDWVVVFDHGDSSEEITCPVIGWATVIDAHLIDGTATTSVQPVFLYVDMLFTPNELREHDFEVQGVEIRARVLPTINETAAAFEAAGRPLNESLAEGITMPRA
ncbi:hypothetical protein [Streptomyces sp. 2A115]|uniref:hypothetical protein n=1 Tax=Streptomyces sp. 2A115 TaxID=3457439 RepID=UPI003FD385DF